VRSAALVAVAVFLVAAASLLSPALAQRGADGDAASWFDFLASECIGLLFGGGCCLFWVVLVLASVFRSARTWPFFGWFWEIEIIRWVLERTHALWARAAGRRQTVRYLRSRTLNERDSKARFQLGVLYMEQRRWGLALAVLEASRTINPDRAVAHLYAAQCLRELGRPEEALAPLSDCLAQRPDHTEAQLLLAETHLVLGRSPDAALVSDAFVTAHPEHAEGWLLRGFARAEMGETAAATEDLRTAIERARTASDVNRARFRRAARRARRRLRAMGG